MRGRRRDGSIDWYWIIVTGGTLAGCLIIILIMALWLAACPGAAEGAFPEPDGPWVAFEPEGYDFTAPPYSPSFLPPWTKHRDFDSVGPYARIELALMGLIPFDRGFYCVHSIPMIGRGLRYCGGWPVSMQYRREQP